MHELALCQAIAAVVRPHVDGRHVDVVRVRVGALRQVVPDALAFCWTVVRDFENMRDAELEVEVVAAVLDCRSCGRNSTICSRWSLLCPQCNSADVEVVGGDELLVMSLDVS